MRTMTRAFLALGAALALALNPALAADNMSVKDASGSTIVVKSKDTGAGVQAPTHTLANSSGTVIDPATSTKQPALGTAGTAASDVITVQGIASMTALKVDGSAVTQPVSIATAPALVASTAIIGKVTTDQTTHGTTDLVAADITKVAGAAVKTGAGTASGAIRVELPTDGTGVVGLSAGELHLGEVGGNQLAVQVAQTVTASSAYTSGNAVGGLITFSAAARVSGSAGAAGTGGLLQSVVVNSKSLQTGAMDLVIFSANPTGTTCTDKTAIDVVAADFDKVLGVAHITDWTALGATRSVAQAQNLAIPYALASSTTLYGCLVTRSTPTFTATTDISVGARLLRN